MTTAFDIKSTVSYTIVGFRRLKSEAKRKCFKSHQLTPKLHKLSMREAPPPHWFTFIVQYYIPFETL